MLTTLTRKILFIAVIGAANFAHAQTHPAIDGKIPAPVEAIAKGVDKSTKLQKFSLGLKWNESGRQFLVPISNPTAAPIDIIGVQATGGLYVSNIPAKIPANGTVKITLLLITREGMSNTHEIVKVLTSIGEQVLQVNHDREPALVFDPSGLRWKVGEANATKDVAVTIKIPGMKLATARCLGGENKATIEDLGSGNYIVHVIAGDTAKPNTFPVFLDTQPRTPGAVAVVHCEVKN